MGFTCYGVDADALDLEAFRWRQLSVELGLHDLVVPHVPALWFKQTQEHGTCSPTIQCLRLNSFSPLTIHLNLKLSRFIMGL